MLFQNLPTSVNILLVDDTPDNLRLLARMLETQGYTVRKTTSGRMALQAAQREPPDLILLDINMPDLNGYEVCQALKQTESTQFIPVIFISALDQLSDKVQAFELGGMDYITKPFQELEVLARVRTQLLIQQQQRQLMIQNQQLEREVQERLEAEAEIRRLNTNLEQTVHLRTAELQQALSFEATLKRISDQVRDSLDQHKILQAAVEELAQVLQVHCCDAVLYSPDRLTSTIRYQYVQPELSPTQGQMLYMADAPELYDQLQQRHCFAFCQLQPTPIRNHSAILACPIYDHQVSAQGILGDLWLFKPRGAEFSSSEIRLVQQVANQCAIALRQAQLFDAAQAQVRELQRLNQLKDDFLSTISHELRTPIANMQLVIQMMASMTEHGQTFISQMQAETQNPKIVQYFQILQEECEHELNLVEDLLKLQQIEAGINILQPTTVNLQTWLPHVVETFEILTHNQQQTLQINLSPDLPPLTTDISNLSRIITELLNNACKYTPSGGCISITAWVEANTLHIRVENTGIEITPSELVHVFDKFYRVPNNDPWKYGGTGLGLTLAKRLIEQMGGAIAVASASNSTCFTVKLALSEGALSK